MTKKISIMFFIFIAFFTKSYAQYTDQEIMEALKINVIECTENLSQYETLKVKIKFTNVLEPKTGCYAEWYQDNIAVPNYSNSNFSFFEGKESQILLDIPFYPNMPTSTTIKFKLTANGITKVISQPITYNTSNAKFDADNSKVKRVEIEATIKYWTSAYQDKSMTKKIGHFLKGDKVIFFDQNSHWSAYVMYNGKYYWVPYSALNISTKNYTVFSDFTAEEKEAFVNSQNYKSNTDYLVWINLERQKVNVFTKQNGKWFYEKGFTCATGTNQNPTPIGEYKYTSNTSGWYFGTTYVKHVLYFSEARQIAFHTRIYNNNGTLSDATMGTPVSHACVRMLDQDVLWLKNYVTIGSKVVVY